jgi:hypothetical protein
MVSRKSFLSLRKEVCMRSILGVLLLLLLFSSGCNDNDILAKMASSMGGGRDKHVSEKTCRRCGTELSKRNKCLNMTCPFNSILQQELCDKERDAARKVNAAYSRLSEQERSETVDKYRAKEMASKPWGMHWACRGCNEPTTCWVATVTVGGKSYKGPFMCCPECEGQLVKLVGYAQDQDSRR